MKAFTPAALGAALLTLCGAPALACDICSKSETQSQHAAHAAAAAARPDDHAPVPIMGDHMHKQGDWMLGYKYMHMSMSGLRDGTDDVSPESVTADGYRIAPRSMDMDMHMLNLMYAPTDRVTLMLMGQYLEKDMTSRVYTGMMGTAPLTDSDMRSSGWGDTTLSALLRLYEDGTHHVHLTAGLSLPTGSTDEEGVMTMPSGMVMTMRLPYGMQLGSGTYDLLPGVTYTGEAGRWGWGAQYSAALRLGENDEDYSFGDRHSLQGWGSYLLSDLASLSLRLGASHEGEIDGRDPAIMAMSTAGDPDNYGGTVIEAGLGLNLLLPFGPLEGKRLEFEAAAPLYQDLNGPQLERDYTISAGLSFSF